MAKFNDGTPKPPRSPEEVVAKEKTRNLLYKLSRPPLHPPDLGAAWLACTGAILAEVLSNGEPTGTQLRHMADGVWLTWDPTGGYGVTTRDEALPAYEHVHANLILLDEARPIAGNRAPSRRVRPPRPTP